MKTNKLNRGLGCLAVAAFGLLVLNAPAADYLKADTTSLTTPADWTTGVVPGPADIGEFNATISSGSESALTLSTNLTVGDFQFDGTLNGAVTIGATTNTLTLNGVNGLGIDMTSANQNVTLNNPVGLGASQTWNVNSGRTLTIGGSVGDSGNGYGLTNAGSGTLVLLGTNTYGGLTTVSGGTLQIGNGGITGALSGSTFINAGTLDFKRTDPTNSPCVVGGSIDGAGTLNLASGAVQLNQSAAAHAINKLSSVAGTTLILAGAPASSTVISNQINTFATSATLSVNSGTWILYNGRAFNGTTLNINGGALQIGTATVNGGRLSMASGSQQLNLHAGGLLNVSNSSYGLRLGGDNGAGDGGYSFAGLQDGGTVLITSAGSGFSLGSSSGSLITSYALSGGLMTVNNAFSIGADTAGTSTTTFGLSGSGKLSVNGTISGSQGTGAQQVFDFAGGTLVASTVSATFLASLAAPTVQGTLVNRGGTLASGDLGTAGKTTITGNYAVSNSSAVLAVDLGGTTQANAFQNGPGDYDFVSVSGTAVLNGSLNVNLINGFVPAAANSFTILTASGGLSGAFTNLTDNFVPVANYPGGYFQLLTTATSVILTNFGTLSLSPVLSVSPSPVYFATLSTGLTETVTITLYNAGLGALTGSFALNGAAFALVGGTNFSLAGGASTNLTISFTPTNNATFNGSLVFTSNGGNETNPVYGYTFIPTPPGTPLIQPGQTVVNAGTTFTFTVPNTATNYAWRLEGTLVSTNGIVGANSASFTYAPTWYDVGTHNLVCYQTLAGGVPTNTYWQVRVRIPLPASGACFYVATNGLDSNPGTLAAPFLTLDAARNAIRGMSQPLPAGGVTVWLRGGTYFRTNTFLLSGSDSGTLSAPIVYCSYPGETAVILAGKPILASAFVPLNSSQTNRVAPGVNPTNILELDLPTAGITHSGPFPTTFGTYVTYNIYGAGSSGGICDLFYNDQRMLLSRYPNHNLINDDNYNNYLKMDGVATTGPGSTNYLNGSGIYTNSAGVPVAVGGAFHYYTNDAAHVARWQTALTNGGLWVSGFWSVDWGNNGAKVGGIDLSNQVIELAAGVNINGGIGSEFSRPAGSHSERYYALNLLEEMSQPGTWAIDFNRNKIYIYTPGPINNGSVVVSDFAAPIVEITNASYVVFQSLTFEDGLAQGILIATNTANNLVTGCTLQNMNNYPLDINGYTNGVVSCLLQNLGGGGVLLHGGNSAATPRVPGCNFVVNNLITNSGVMARVYATPIDTGGNGEGGGGNSVGNRVAHNYMTMIPHLVILHGQTWDNRIEYNNVGNYGQLSSGIGGIYGYSYYYSSGNNYFRYNFVHDSYYEDGITFDEDHRQAHVYGNVLDLNAQNQCLGTETGEQATSGYQQYLDHYNNLGLNASHGFDVVAPVGSTIEENAMINCTTPYTWEQVVIGTTNNTFVGSSAAVLESGPNESYTSDPGFLNLANEDLRLKPSSEIYADMPAFTQIPFEMMGLYNDEYRTNAPGWSPYVIATAATAFNLTNTTAATCNGQLCYPQFNSNSVVTLYWGTRDGGTNFGAWQQAASLGVQAAGGLVASLTGLNNQGPYYYRYYASNAYGSAWSPATVSFGTNLVPLLTAVSSNASAILSWTTPYEATGYGLTGYDLGRATNHGGPYTLVASNLNATMFTDTGLVNGWVYYYVVAAQGAGGVGSNSVEAVATPLVPPAAPTGLAAVAGSMTVALSWKSVAAATSYNVKRAMVSGGPYTTLFSGSAGTNVTDNNAYNGVTYFYVVSGVNGGGEGANSEEVSVTPTLGIAHTAANLVWQGDGVTNAWDQQDPANLVWLNNGTNVTFWNGDTVTFNDSGSESPALNLLIPVAPAGVVEFNTANTYTLSGVGNLTGSCSLQKDGSGTLTILTGNNNSGTNVINAGTLQIGNGGVTGALSGNTLINAGTLDFKRADATNSPYIVGGSIDGAGTLNVASGAVQLNQSAGSHGLTVISGAADTTLILAGAAASSTVLTNAVNGFGGATVAVNAGTWIMWNNGGSAFNGAALNVNGGTLQVGTAAQNATRLAFNTANQQMNIHAGGTLMVTNATYSLRLGSDNGTGYGGGTSFTGLQDGGTVVINGQSGFNLGASGPSSGSFTDSYTLSGGLMTMNSGFSIGADTAGTCLTTFSLTNTGKLYVNNTISGSQGAGAQQVFDFAGGTLVASTVSATFLASLAVPTVQGTLVNRGGTLAPGDLGTPGKTTITGNYSSTNSAAVLAIDVGGTTQANAFTNVVTDYDFVSISGTATLGGNLNVNRINNFIPAANNAFTVLTASGGVSGMFANAANSRVAVANVPGASFQVLTSATSVILTNYAVLLASFTASATNGLSPLAVNFTDTSVGTITNRSWIFGDGFTTNTTVTSLAHTFTAAGTDLVSLTVSGPAGANTSTLPVVVMASVPPVIGGVQIVGGQLVITGTNGTAGVNYYVLATTNLSLPVTNWSSIATQQFGPGGSVNFTNPLNLNGPQTFYRLRLP